MNVSMELINEYEIGWFQKKNEWSSPVGDLRRKRQRHNHKNCAPTGTAYLEKYQMPVKPSPQTIPELIGKQ